MVDATSKPAGGSIRKRFRWIDGKLGLSAAGKKYSFCEFDGQRVAQRGGEGAGDR